MLTIATHGLAYKKKIDSALTKFEFFELKIRISSRKLIFQKNNFSLFIIGPGGLDS